MPLHPQAVAVLELLASFGDPPIDQDTPENVRRLRAARRRPSTEPVHEIRDVDANGVPCRFYRPSPDGTLGLTVYIHGGGWVIGDLNSHDAVCRSLANHSGHAVLSVDYRLSPEARFPAALTDCLQALRWAADHATDLGVDTARFAIGGDSAGANMAAVVAQMQPVSLRFQLLIYPVTDASCSAPSWEENSQGPFLTAAGMKWFWNHYLGDTPPTIDDPRISPLAAAPDRLATCPPAYVLTAEFDPLRDEGERYASRLAAAGVPVALHRFYGMYHGFFSMKGVLDDADAAHATAGAALRMALR